MDNREFLVENEEENIVEQIKKEDKKSMIKFMVILVCCGIIGGFAGFGAAFAEDMNLTAGMGEFAIRILEAVAPYANIALTAVSGIVIAVMYRQSRKLYEKWTEEDDEIMNQIEKKCSYCLMITSIVAILGCMFFTIGFGKLIRHDEVNILEFVILMIGFVALLVFILVAQRAIVNFEKEMNPEKKGSVFDMKFQKKWTDSCDEAEMQQIYKASYASYKTTNMTCLILWMFCVFGMMLWDIAYVPIVMVTIIWLVSTVSYCIEAMKTLNK